MPLTFDSPRFLARNASLRGIAKAIDRVGHVVIDGLWDPSFVRGLQRFSEPHFAADPSEATHLPGDLRCLSGWNEQGFVDAIEQSRLPRILHHLLRGDVVVSHNEHVIRRADAKVTGLFSGLHYDGQLRPCSDEGINSKREFTIWTPLVDCTTEDTPRLLLLARGQTFTDVFGVDELVSDEGVKYWPLQLRPTLASEGLNSVSLDQLFERLYAAKQCYAPHVPIGSAILFEHNITHGSYRRGKMKNPRSSMDFRAVGVYRETDANRHYSGTAFPVPPSVPRMLMTRARSMFETAVGR